MLENEKSVMRSAIEADPNFLHKLNDSNSSGASMNRGLVALISEPIDRVGVDDVNLDFDFSD